MTEEASDPTTCSPTHTSRPDLSCSTLSYPQHPSHLCSIFLPPPCHLAWMLLCWTWNRSSAADQARTSALAQVTVSGLHCRFYCRVVKLVSFIKATSSHGACWGPEVSKQELTSLSRWRPRRLWFSPRNTLAVLSLPILNLRGCPLVLVLCRMQWMLCWRPRVMHAGLDWAIIWLYLWTSVWVSSSFEKYHFMIYFGVLSSLFVILRYQPCPSHSNHCQNSAWFQWKQDEVYCLISFITRQHRHRRKVISLSSQILSFHPLLLVKKPLGSLLAG